MNNYSQELLNFLLSLKAQKKHIVNLLNSDSDKVYVYYIAPLSNVIRIYNTGGILPRNLATNYVDLSGHNIQSNRNKLIEVGGNSAKRKVRLHDCINYFLNPLNNTYYQFRRNALVRAQAGDPWSQWVCILELDLGIVLDDNDIHWGVTNKNIAISGSICSSNKMEYSRFDWEKIYSVGLINSQERFNEYRSAEFIVHIPAKNNIEHIPVKAIERILVASQDLARGAKHYIENLPFDIFPLKTYENIFVYKNPLHPDRKWVETLASLNLAGISETSVINSLRRLLNVEDEIRLRLIDSFEVPRIGKGDLHGIGHVNRVMLWILLLAEAVKTAGYLITKDEITAALYAGFFHDLCRKNNYEESYHGQEAAEKYKEILHTHLPESVANRCIKAITVHSQDTDPPDDDIVWILLKDADALDRGRFAPPRTNRGCNPEKLRLTVFKSNPRLLNECLWSAYWLPRITRYINWENNACKEFVLSLLTSINLVMTFEKLPAQNYALAREICLGVIKSEGQDN